MYLKLNFKSCIYTSIYFTFIKAYIRLCLTAHVEQKELIMVPRPVIVWIPNINHPHNVEYWEARTPMREVLTQLKKFWGLRLLPVLVIALIFTALISQTIPKPSLFALMGCFLTVSVVISWCVFFFVFGGLAADKREKYLHDESTKAELPAKLEAARIAEVKRVAAGRVACQKRLMTHKPRLVPSYKLRRETKRQMVAVKNSARKHHYVPCRYCDSW